MHDVCAALYYQFLHDNKKNIRGDDLDTSPNASADDDVIGPNIQEGGGTAPEAARSRPTSPSADTAADEAKYFLSDHDMFGTLAHHCCHSAPPIYPVAAELLCQIPKRPCSTTYMNVFCRLLCKVASICTVTMLWKRCWRTRKECGECCKR